jgi:hypothetical protein
MLGRAPLHSQTTSIDENETEGHHHQPVPESDQKDGAEQHPEQARVDRMARDAIWTVGTKLVLDLDHRRGAPHRAQRDAGPEREDGRADEKGQAEDPDPGCPDRQQVPV